MDDRSTDQLDVELKDDDWIDVCKDETEYGDKEIADDSDNSVTEKLRKSVTIKEPENPFRFPVSNTEEKSTSTHSLEVDTNKSDQKRSLKFWDKWLKFFVLIGAGVSVSILCLILIEEESRKVMGN